VEKPDNEYDEADAMRELEMLVRFLGRDKFEHLEPEPEPVSHADARNS
jgi:hypothetical protein